MTLLILGALAWALLKQIAMGVVLILAIGLVPFIARAIVGWHLDPGGADSDLGLLGWGLGAVLMPSALLAIALSGLDGRTQAVLATPTVTFLAVCSWKAFTRIRFHGLI